LFGAIPGAGYNDPMADDRPWFKWKRYGWGWTPATKEGWAVIFTYALLFVAGELFFVPKLDYDPSVSLLAAYAVFIIALIGALIYTCYRKGEKTR
jgi:hypothetical protein